MLVRRLWRLFVRDQNNSEYRDRAPSISDNTRICVELRHHVECLGSNLGRLSRGLLSNMTILPICAPDWSALLKDNSRRPYKRASQDISEIPEYQPLYQTVSRSFSPLLEKPLKNKIKNKDKIPDEELQLE